MTHHRLAAAVASLVLLGPVGLLGLPGAASATDTPAPDPSGYAGPTVVDPVVDPASGPTAGTDQTPPPDSSTTPAPDSSTTPAPASDSAPARQPAAAGDQPMNQPPVALDDHEQRVMAGRSVRLQVLANDTDDGLGRPPDEIPHLEIAWFSPRGGRVTIDGTRTILTFTPRITDPGHRLEVRYTADDGSLTSEPARTVVAVDPPPPPPPSVSIDAGTGMIALHQYRISGRVAPRTPTATVSVQQWTSGRWRELRSERVGPRGGFAVPFGTNRPARYSFRAVATWPDGTRAISRTMRRRVVPHSEARVSGPLTRRDVPWSYRSGCPVRPSGLRRIRVNRFTYSHLVARGSLVVKASAVPDLVRVFRTAFADRFPVRSMRPADAFYDHGRRTPTGSDIAAMQADNTSAFNCRPVTGNPYRISQHSYGNAIDINTVRNPYVVGTRVYPSWARTYLDRSNVRTGMILRGGSVERTMTANRWLWGARWSHPDYQHFSANGG